MGLKGDIDELKEIWPQLPLSFKAFLVISFVLSCLSITSIADSVYELRGFLKEAVEFYRAIISPLLIKLLSHLGLTISQIQADVILFITLINASLIRANLICKFRGTPADIGTWIVFMYLAYNSTDQSAYGLVYGHFGVVCFFSLLSVLMYRLKQYKLFVTYKIALINILAVVFFVSVFAAVSDGLHRAL